MSTLQTWSPWISPLAEKLARQLAVQYSIRDGFGLAIYLDVDRCYKNHHAIRIWVQRLLDEDAQVDFDCLNTMIVSLFPSESFS
jgi:hypothetical protein